MHGLSGRVGSLAWNGDVVSSGSLGGLVSQHDVRMPSFVAKGLIGHHGEVSRK
jgi:hypothetical protein